MQKVPKKSRKNEAISPLWTNLTKLNGVVP